MIAILIIVGILAIVFGLTLAKAGAMADYNLAVEKCKDCVYFGQQNPSQRQIYCMKRNLWLIPEEVFDCKFKDTNHAETEE